jgi:hypothetical protein
MAQYKFTVCRTSIVSETFEIEADTWEEAEQALYEGAYSEPIDQEWIDWHGGWEEVDREALCPLTRMVKEYDKTVDKEAV